MSETYVYPMLIVALITVAKKKKQPILLLPNKWIKKMLRIQSKEYYSAMKKKKILSFETT